MHSQLIFTTGFASCSVLLVKKKITVQGLMSLSSFSKKAQGLNSSLTLFINVAVNEGIHDFAQNFSFIIWFWLCRLLSK